MTALSRAAGRWLTRPNSLAVPSWRAAHPHQAPPALLTVSTVVGVRPGKRSGAHVSLVGREHAGGDTGDLHLAPDRALVRQLVVAPQRGDAAQPAGPARVRRVGGVEPAVRHGEPGL